MDAGKIVPAKITIGLIRDAMRARDCPSNQFIIDGFPRNPENFEMWYEEMDDKAFVPFVIFMDAKEETMIKHILERKKEFKRDGKIVRRDDTLEMFMKRYKVFNEDTMSVARKFEMEGQVIRICADLEADEKLNELHEQLRHIGIM